MAFSLARTARRGLPDSQSAAETLGWAYYNLGLYKSAIDLLQEVVQAKPKNARGTITSSGWHTGGKDTAMGRNELEATMEIDPDYTQDTQIRKILAGAHKATANSALVRSVLTETK